MNIARISTILMDSEGEVDENQQPVEGSELFNFIVVKVVMKTAKVHEHAEEMAELLKEWPTESWGQPVPPLGKEISYITAGGVLDDQLRAFLLFAFGKIAGWWDILDPHTMLKLDYDDPKAREMAGMGMIAIMGYRPSVAA